MIKEFKIDYLDEVMKIWLETNIIAHYFIEKEYWINNFDLVKELLPDAKVYIFQEDNIIKGFIGIIEEGYIAGLFVKSEYQREGIGKALIEYIKPKYKQLTLDVYAKNKNAINFYCKNNFKVVNEKKNEDTKELEYEMIFSKGLYWFKLIGRFLSTFIVLYNKNKMKIYIIKITIVAIFENKMDRILVEC